MKAVNIAVVGAGAAGCCAAFFLASAGIKVVLIDQASFPRDKTCGDLITREGLQVLERAGLNWWADQFPEIKKLRFTSPDRQVLDVSVKEHLHDCVGRLIPRKLLDARLAEAAVQAGASFMDGTNVERVDIFKGEGVRVKTDKEQISARMVILADGSNAPITRQLGLLHSKPDLFAVRQYLEGDIDPAGALEFHFQKNIIPGYTWMFPMGNGCLNVGAGTYSHRVQNKEIDLKAVLEQFRLNHPLSPDRLAKTQPLGQIKGHFLRTNLNETRTHSDHVLVAGDAAGLVSPFTGEGIASGMRSGEAAAMYAFQALIKWTFDEKHLCAYSTAIRERYAGDQQAGRTLRSILRHPSLLNRVFQRMRKNDRLARLFARIFLDEASPQLLLHPTILMQFLRR